jgi:formylglycine-generating enzyme
MSLTALPPVACVPAGEFEMGDPQGHPDQRPVHRVHLDGFEIAVHPVTVAQYARFVRETGHREPAVYEIPLVAAGGGRDREESFRSIAAAYAWAGHAPPPDRLDHPVTLVRWEDANAYCGWLASVTGRHVRLPTEAEWERAARGPDHAGPYPWGGALDPARANYLADASRRDDGGTTPVTRFPPNGFGLCDVIGNVWEWVADWYANDYYLTSPAENPRGPLRGAMRVVRGGGWPTSEPEMLTCSYRHTVPPDTYSYSIGFRFVISG